MPFKRTPELKYTTVFCSGICRSMVIAVLVAAERQSADRGGEPFAIRRECQPDANCSTLERHHRHDVDRGHALLYVLGGLRRRSEQVCSREGCEVEIQDD